MSPDTPSADPIAEGENENFRTAPISDEELQELRWALQAKPTVIWTSVVEGLLVRLDVAERALGVIADNQSGTALYLQDFARAVLSGWPRKGMSMAESPDIHPIAEGTPTERERLEALAETGDLGWVHVDALLTALDARDAEVVELCEALERIADMPNGGIPGHAVAVGCRHNIIAWKALHAPDERECEKCDGAGYTMDYGPWKTTTALTNSPTPGDVGSVITDERAEPGHPGAVSYGRQIPCDCDNGWLPALAPTNPKGASDG
jgi:hypothetical protein